MCSRLSGLSRNIDIRLVGSVSQQDPDREKLCKHSFLATTEYIRGRFRLAYAVVHGFWELLPFNIIKILGHSLLVKWLKISRKRHYEIELTIVWVYS